MGLWRGGGENFDLNLAYSLKRLGCEVEFITGCLKKRILYPVREFSTKYVYTPYLGIINKKLKIKMPGFGKLWILDMVWWGKKVLKNLGLYIKEFDAVWVLGLPDLAYNIQKYYKIPVGVRFPGPPDKLWYKIIRKLPLIFANGDAYNQLQFISPSNLIYLNPGVQPPPRYMKLTEIKSLKSKLKISNRDKILLFVGRLVPIKNLPFLISGFKKMKYKINTLKLLIIGEGPEKAKILKLIDKYRLNNDVLLLGYIENKELWKYYQISDIFVLTSNYDNFPNVILEAMINKLPIVATRVGGISLQIKDGINGYLVTPNNIDVLVEKIVTLLYNEDLKEKIVKYNYKYVQRNFSWEKSGEIVYRKFYELKTYIKR